MNLQAFRYFIAAYEEGSISRGARRCHVAQPSVSQAVHQLEAELRTRLFDRSVRGLIPTPSGMALAGRVRAILDSVDSIAADFRASAVPAAVVRLYVHPTIALRKLTSVFLALGSIEGLDLRLTEDRREAEIAIIPSEGGQSETQLWREHYALLIPVVHPLAKLETIRLADLYGMRMIARCACERPHIFPTDLVKPVFVAQAHDEDSVISLVAAAVGLAVAPGYDLVNPAVVARQIDGFQVNRRIMAVGNSALIECARRAIAADDPP